jgi:argininosuccinate lyase
LKEKLFPAFQVLKDCLDMIGLMVENMQVKQDILADARYRYVFTVESVNQLVLSGMPFREAYHQVSQEVTAGTYEPAPMLPHTHLGSIGNLGNDRIAAGMEAVLGGFGFERVLAAEEGLLGG